MNPITRTLRRIFRRPPFIIRAGFDLSKTSFAYKLFDLDPIPANAFGPGSDAFVGRIDWVSGPLAEFRGFALPAGSADTVVQRLENAALWGAGSSATIPVQMMALSFHGMRPITITFNGGERSEEWSVYAVAPNNPAGVMTITQTSDEGGVFSSEFHVHPIFTFTRLSDGVQATVDVVAAGLPPNIVRQENVPWMFEPTREAATARHRVLRMPGLTSNFVPGYTVDEGRGLMVGTAFSPTNRVGQARGAHGHFAS